MDDMYFSDAGLPDNTGGNTGGNTDSGTVTTTDYDETVIKHNANAAETASEVKLTIEQTSANTLTVYAESTNTDAVDFITLSSVPAGAGLSASSVTNGVASIDVFWPQNDMPATTTFDVLWSKESGEGNWQPVGCGSGYDRYQLWCEYWWQHRWFWWRADRERTFDDDTGWSGDGVNPVNGINTANVSRAGNSYDVNMSITVATEPNKDYTLTFDAKGTDGRLLYAGIGDDGGPYAADKQNLQLTDSWQTFVIHLNSAGQNHSAQRAFFEMGHDTGLVDIDNVSLVEGHVGTEAPHLPVGNLLGASG